MAESEQLSAEDRARERLVFGLRRLDGLDLRQFAEQTGFTVSELAEPALTNLCQLGLLSRDDQRLRLTRAGLLVSDAIWPEFLRV